MKKIKSYTGIWNVEKVLYAINDFNLPFPVTFTQITWFVIMEFIIILFGDIPPLSMIEGAFLKYFGIPVKLNKRYINDYVQYVKSDFLAGHGFGATQQLGETTGIYMGWTIWCGCVRL